MSTAMTGPAADLGTEMSRGVRAAFEEANRNGGIRGHRLELIVLDDGYEPERTVPNMRELLDVRGVAGIVGNVGTPTAVAALPIAAEKQVLFFGAFTGARVLRKTPPDPNVFNVRASYAEETGAMVEALVKFGGLQPTEIACFTQRDAYGDSGFEGARNALLRAGLPADHSITHGRYERNTTDIEGGLADILMADPAPRAVIMVGTYKPCALFVRQARQAGLKSLFLNVSFVGAASLAREAGADSENVIVTQVVPHPGSSLPFVSQYRDALKALEPDQAASFGSLEGYLAGRVLCAALERVKGDVSRAGLPDALRGLGKFDLGLGTELEFGPGLQQASHTVWPTVIRGGRVEAVEWSLLSKFVPSRP
jgi:ABC-type branched-subunit amino acid transport system substrate-binding protein